MQVVSGPMGRERVHFEAPAAERLVDEMEQFLAWFNGSAELDPVLKAGIAHFWFVTIHPFEDGNGRIARAIADLLLTRADGLSHRFYSMSAQIEAERKVSVSTSKPATDRQLKTRHLHGAFRPTGLLAAVPQKEACNGECNEDDDDSGDSIATICGTVVS